MVETLTLQEMWAQYPGEWLLIAVTGLDEDDRVTGGRVLAHSPDRDAIYRRLLDVKGERVAIEYAGPIPEDLAVVL